MIHFFKKEIPNRPLYLPTGQRVGFSYVDLDYGYLMTEDPVLIAELEKTVGRLGVVRSNESEWNEFQKKKNSSPLGQFLRRERESITALSIPNLRLSLAAQEVARFADQGNNQGQPNGPRRRAQVPPVVKVDSGQPVAPLEVPIVFPKLGRAKPA